MASRRDYYYRELVTEAELDAGFEGLEDADRALVTDFGYVGVHYGAAVSQKAGSQNLSVDVSAGAAYDQDGQRCLVPSVQNVDVSKDSDNVSTSVSGVGNERWVSVFLVFDRALSDQRTDGNSNPVMFVRDESYKFTVVQGAEAALGTATRPGLLSSGVLLADVKLVHSQSQVLNADVSASRRLWPFSVAGSPRSLARGRALDAFTDLLGYYNNHVNGTADKHGAAALDYAGGGTWADGGTNPAATVEAQLDKIITDLGSGAGTAKVHAQGFSVGGVVTVAGGTAEAQIQTLTLATSHLYAGGSAWLDGATNPSVTVEAQLDKIITDLIGQGASSSGAHKIGIGARTTWLGGRTNVAATVFAAVDKIITDLALTTASDDGCERVGAQASGNLSAGSARSQLDELDAEKGGLALANEWTQDNTFDADLLFSSTNASPAVSVTQRAGTGANDGAALVIRAQRGQNQSGGSANNDGGNLDRGPGKYGAGGSGAAGQYGDDVLTFDDVRYTRFGLEDDASSSSVTTVRQVLLTTAGMMAKVKVTAFGLNSNGTRGQKTIIGTFHNASGTVSQVGSTTTECSHSNNTGFDVAFSVSGHTVSVDVTAGTTGGTTTDEGVWVDVTEFRFLPAS